MNTEEAEVQAQAEAEAEAKAKAELSLVSEPSQREVAQDMSYDSDTIFEADNEDNTNPKQVSHAKATPRWGIKNNQTTGVLDRSLASIVISEEEKVKDADSLLDALENICDVGALDEDTCDKKGTTDQKDSAIEDLNGYFKEYPRQEAPYFNQEQNIPLFRNLNSEVSAV